MAKKNNMSKNQKQKKKSKYSRTEKLQVVSIIMLSIVILFATGYGYNQEVQNVEEAAQVKFGLPFAFIVQDHSEVISEYPAVVEMQDPFIFKSSIMMIGLGLNFLVWFLVTGVIYGGIKRIYYKIRR